MHRDRQVTCDENLYNVQNYLMDGSYPSSATEDLKRLIRKRSKDFVIRERVMLYKKKKLDCEKIVLLDITDRRRAFDECHASASGGHQGRDRTEGKMKTYYWPNMSIDIRRWVSSFIRLINVRDYPYC